MSEISTSMSSSNIKLEDAVARETQSYRNQQHPIGDGIAMMLYIMDLLSRFTSQRLDEMQAKSDISRDAQDMANKVEAAMARLLKPEDKTPVPDDVVAYMRAKNILVGGFTIDELIGKNSEALPHLKKLAQLIEQANDDGMETRSWQEIISYMDSKGMKIDGKKVADYVWELPEVGGRSGRKVTKEHMKVILATLQSSVGLDKADLMSVKAALESVSGRASDFVQQMQLKMQQLIQNYNTAVQMINSLQSMLAESTKGVASAIR